MSAFGARQGYSSPVQLQSLCVLVSYTTLAKTGFVRLTRRRISPVLCPMGVLTKRMYHNDPNISSMLGMTL